MKYPVLIHSEHILRDSEGAGRYCGSPALQVEFGSLESELTAVWLSEGTRYEAIGVQGGKNGCLARQYVRNSEGELSEPLGTYEQVTVKPGERVVSIGSGGAGYGPPGTRDPGRVARDVQRGWVSPERARETYRVALNEDGAVDAAQTAALRSG